MQGLMPASNAWAAFDVHMHAKAINYQRHNSKRYSLEVLIYAYIHLYTSII